MTSVTREWTFKLIVKFYLIKTYECESFNSNELLFETTYISICKITNSMIAKKLKWRIPNLIDLFVFFFFNYCADTGSQIHTLISILIIEVWAITEREASSVRKFVFS